MRTQQSRREVRRQEVRTKVRYKMRAQERPEMRRQVRAQELSKMFSGRRANQRLSKARDAGPRLLAAYSALAERGEHLFGSMMMGRPPNQWKHYPEDDAIDMERGYQWYYHSHSPEDRPGVVEHGHIHLFARRPLWSRRLQSRSEKAFARPCGQPAADANTRHLLAIGFDAKGIPSSLFTVNSWVTGDLMLGADLTVDLLASMQLDTGHSEVDAVIESTVRMCMSEIANLMLARDQALRLHAGRDKLSDPSLEVLSEVTIDLDSKLSD